jgi:hypothetical protein
MLSNFKTHAKEQVLKK